MNFKKGSVVRSVVITVFIFIISGLLFWYPTVRMRVREYAYQGAGCLVYPFIHSYTICADRWHAWHMQRMRHTDLCVNYAVLQERYRQLDADHRSLQATYSYSKDIQPHIDQFKKRFEDTIGFPATVMAVNIETKSHTMLVEGGQTAGVQENMVAVVDNLLVGKVVTVYPWYAVVRLLTDPKSCVAAYGVQSKCHGIVCGTGDPNLLNLERVEHMAQVAPGELLLSSGEGMVVPRGYSIGMVQAATLDGLYHTITVSGLVNAHELHTVLLVGREHVVKNSCVPE